MTEHNPKPDDTPGESTVPTMFRATFALREWMDEFFKAAPIASFPKAIDAAGFAMFQVAMRILEMQETRVFRMDLLTLLCEIVERTRADPGGLDMKTLQREMSARNVAVAMGPDPEILQALIRGGNHAQSVQDQEIAELRGQVRSAQDVLQALLARTEESTGTTVDRATVQGILELLAPAKVDPGSIPQNVRMDGEL